MNEKLRHAQTQYMYVEHENTHDSRSLYSVNFSIILSNPKPEFPALLNPAGFGFEKYPDFRIQVNSGCKPLYC